MITIRMITRHSLSIYRRFDGPDPYRFMAPQASGPFPPSAYFQSLAQQPRMPLPTSLLFPNTKVADVIGR